MENGQSNKKLKLTSSSSSPSDDIEIIPNHLILHLGHKLPGDLILDIFYRLPVKSLCRFKCVSKSMKSLIQHPVFIKKHRLRLQTPFKWAIPDFGENVLLVTAGKDGLTKTKKITYPDHLFEFRYCNGLIAFDYNGICLSNITTGEAIELEPPIDGFEGYCELGFDPCLKKHKVLVWKECQGILSDCYIRTLEEGTSWRPISNVPQVLRKRNYQEDDRPEFCYANGTLYWFIGKEKIMVSFDVANEQFGTVQLPEKLSDMVNQDEFMYSLFEFEGCLCLVEQPSSYQYKCNLEIVNMWMLKDIENSVWVTMLKNKMLPLEGTDLRNYFLEVYHPFEAIFLSHNSEIMIATVDGDHKYIFLYSFLSGQFERIEIFGKLGGIHHFRVNNYVANYLSLEDFGWEL